MTLEHGRGDYFAARIVLQTNVVAVPTPVPLHVYSTTPFPNRSIYVYIRIYVPRILY